MLYRITIVSRHPERIRNGVEAARALSRAGGQARIVFLCPECASRSECSREAVSAEGVCPDCYTDRCEDCRPEGFRYAETSHIARMLRDSDLVVPV